MGLWRGKAQNILLVFKVQIVQKNQRIKEKDAYKQEKRRESRG
jgi:hypothetical protein